MRYAGKVSNMYPTDPVEALKVDEILEVVSEMLSKCPQNKDPEEKKKLREAFAANNLPVYFNFLSKKSNGSYFVGGKLSIADLAAYALLKNIRKGDWDFIPVDSDTKFPGIQQFIDTLETDPALASYKL